MAIVQYKVRTSRLVENGVDPRQAVTIDLFPVHWLLEITMPSHTEANEWQRDFFAEEDLPYARRHLSEGISYTADHYVLEEGSDLNEWRALIYSREIAFFDDAER